MALRENGMDWYEGDNYVSVYVMHGKWKTQLNKLLKSDPDSIRITTRNKDGSYIAEVPIDYINIRKPRKGKPMTDEQKQKSRELLAQARLKKAQQI